MEKFTLSVRIYVGLLLMVSFGFGFVAANIDAAQQLHDQRVSFVEVLLVAGITAFYAALPVLVVTALGWVVFGGLRK